MKIIKNFNSFKLNEDFFSKEDITPAPSDLGGTGGEITLYRLTSHPVVDLSTPGEYYVDSLENVSPDYLDNQDPNDELFLITVKCASSNIDEQRSEQECAQFGCDCIVAVKDDTQCEVLSVEPFNK